MGLPAGWEDAVPEALWPDALISAVQRDAGALGAPRAIATVRAWQAEARQQTDPDARRRAADRLRSLADALLSDSAPEPTEPHVSLMSLYEEPPTASLALPAGVPPRPSKPAPARPRASILQVKALHAAIAPFCRELIPLSYERRSRRFWAYWREVSGDRGVRRDLVEGLLSSVRDVRTLLTELIAEVQSVDADSVRGLIEQIEAEAEAEGTARPSRPPPAAKEERARPLIGASVRVSAATKDTEEK